MSSLDLSSSGKIEQKLNQRRLYTRMAESVKRNEENNASETTESNRVRWGSGGKMISDKMTFTHKSEKKPWISRKRDYWVDGTVTANDLKVKCAWSTKKVVWVE